MSVLYGLDDVVEGLSEYELFLLEALLTHRESEQGKLLQSGQKRDMATEFVAARQEKKKAEQTSRRKAGGQRRASVRETRSRDFTWVPPTPRRKPGGH